MKLKITVICSVVFSLFFFLLLFLVIFFADDTDSGENNKDSSISQGGVTVSPEVLAHRPLIEKYGKEYGIEDYVSYILPLCKWNRAVQQKMLCKVPNLWVYRPTV